MSDDLMGLAAAARKARDPKITVTVLREAVVSGRLHHEKGIGGIRMVRLSDVKALAAPIAPKAPNPSTPKTAGVRLPKRKSRARK